MAGKFGPISHAKKHSLSSDKDHAGTVEDTQFEGTAGTQANTPSTGTWNVAGTARKVLVYDDVSGKPKWDYLVAYEIMNPAQILTFYAKPSGSYPDGTNGVAMIAGSGIDTPTFTLTYQGTPSACSVDIQAESGTPAAEVNPADYPYSLSTPFLSGNGPAINRKTSAVSTYVTFRATATIDGQSKTKDATITYLNERMYGVSNVVIDTQGEIDTFRAAATKALSNSKSASFTLNPVDQYLYFIFRAALGTPSFVINGFPADSDMENKGPVSWANPRGFTENYSVWKSIYLLTGSYAVVVT